VPARGNLQDLRKSREIAVVDGIQPTENQDKVVYPAAFQTVGGGVRPDAEKVCSFKPSPAVVATNTVIERCKAAVIRLEQDKQTWSDWRDACAGMLEIQTLAMRAAQTNKPVGPQYRQTVKLFLVGHRLDHIHKSTRSLMCEVARNMDAIESWRSKLPADELLELNHPRVVLNHWKRSLRPCSDQDDLADLEVLEPNPFLVGWNKSTHEQRTTGLTEIPFDEFRQVMPEVWCKPMKDCVARLRTEDRDPDSRITRAIQKALEHIEIADDPKTSGPVGQGHEKEALNQLRVALKALRAIKLRVHELDVGISAASKTKRRDQ
jgi:hypothetical protein